MSPDPHRGWQATEGAPFPLGVSHVADQDAYNFALYSKHADRVTLLLYGVSDLRTPVRSVELDPRRNRSGRIWHCRLPRADLEQARYYAYTVQGAQNSCGPPWHAFDADKILLDPYAREIYSPPTFDRALACQAGSNAGKAALGHLTPVRLRRGDADPTTMRIWSSTSFTYAGSPNIRRASSRRAIVEPMPV